MKTHIIALAAVFGLATFGFAGELDREFKSNNLQVTTTAPPATSGSANAPLARTELDDESPIQAGRFHGGWGGGWGHRAGWGGGWGHHGGWG